MPNIRIGKWHSANRVKRVFMRIYLASIETDVREEFVSFIAGFDEYSDISDLDGRRP
jgi:hypothetical protein